MSHQATARLFIALDLPGGLRDDLSAWARLALRRACADGPPPPSRRRDGSGQRRGARGAHGIRALDAELLHITVSFLGTRPTHEIEPLCELVESFAHPRMAQASIGAPLWLPPRRPRALAVEVHDDSGALAELHRALSADLRAAGLAPAAPTHDAGQRVYRPHVTVARLRQDAVPRDRALEPTPQRDFVAERLVLYRSWLSPEGASYEALASSASAS